MEHAGSAVTSPDMTTITDKKAGDVAERAKSIAFLEEGAVWGDEACIVALAVITALDERVKELERQRNKLSEFFDKYALGPKTAPSCLVCGQSVTGTPAIQHAELPGIVVCHPCRDSTIARQAPTSTGKTDYGLLDWMDEDAP